MGKNEKEIAFGAGSRKSAARYEESKESLRASIPVLETPEAMEEPESVQPLENAVLLDNLGKIAYTLDKTYLSRLASDYGILLFDKYNKGTVEDGGAKNDLITYPSNIRALRVKRWVYDKDEKIGDCFKNVISVFAGGEQTIALVLHRTSAETEMYFVTKSAGVGLNEQSKNSIQLLDASLRGNFPGSDTEIMRSVGDTEDLFRFEGMNAVSCLCNIPSEKSEDYLCQGIDKLLNSIVPAEGTSYYIVIMAAPLSPQEQRELLHSYEELATAIAPFSGYQFQVGRNQANTLGEMSSQTETNGISESITKTHSINVGINANLSGSISRMISTAVAKGWNIGAHLGYEVIGGISGGYHRDRTVTEGSAGTAGGSIGASLGYGYSWGRTEGRNFSAGQTTGINRSVSLGTSENTTYTYQSYLVKDLLKKLEETIQRIAESQATGLWKTASYVLASDLVMSKNIANFLRAITQGDKSYIEPAFIQSWSYEHRREGETSELDELKKYLSHFSHPVFLNLLDGTAVMPTANASTTELSNIFAFPRYSIQGVPVIQCARFGREPHSFREIHRDIRLGCTYHMHQAEERNPIYRGRQELTAHTFITGSTGKGKSTTIYTLLSELCLRSGASAKFLVIEPAKGEYKKDLGGYEGVSVYGTNPKLAPLLRLNPFSFPAEIHVLEHIDRLVEVFNACWPMYAAMPAVLKDAMEAAYVGCGWSLVRSECPGGRFPTFGDLLRRLPEIMESSAYSRDTKGDYTGALVTRVKSLTNGINGQIFCSDRELDGAALFDENVIVDLSRVGSMETKALLMGILMIKLQEYRMANAGDSNEQLRHVTVLEEAHHLLRRTSPDQSQEGANLQGKAVEMLSNAIAEMRTYGEGFLIADQAPGLLDMSVIRNTNTKIIMGLPDETDRQLVGRAAGLSDGQIAELAHLDRGIAAVIQNHWLEPVLCRVDCFDKKKPFESGQALQTACDPDMELFFSRLLSSGLEGEDLPEERADRLLRWIDQQDVGVVEKKLLRQAVVHGKPIPEEQRGHVLYCLIKGKSLLGQAKQTSDPAFARQIADQRISDILRVSEALAEQIRMMAAAYAANRTERGEEQLRELMSKKEVR